MWILIMLKWQLVQIVQFELFMVVCTCFWYAGQGYDHIVWGKDEKRLERY